MEAFVTVASFDNQNSAETFYRWVRDAGLRADVIDVGETEALSFFVERRVKYKVRVAEEQAEGARRILGLGRGRLPGLLLCPQCQGSRLEYPQITRKFPGLFTIRSSESCAELGLYGQSFTVRIVS